MSALAMILTVAIVVPGDGRSEKVLGEAVKPQVLDLKGEWMVTFDSIDKSLRINGQEFMRSLKVRDEGGGNLRMTVSRNGKKCPCLGIYRQEGDKVLISWCPEERGRPTGFQKTVNIITLRRVQPAK